MIVDKKVDIFAFMFCGRNDIGSYVLYCSGSFWDNAEVYLIATLLQVDIMGKLVKISIKGLPI